MSAEKIAIKIVPTPATQDISDHKLEKLARITKLPSDRIRERISRGKGIVIITPDHPKVAELTELIKTLGFSVTVTPANAVTPSPRHSRAVPPGSKLDDTEWNVGEVIENLYEVLDIKQGGMGAVYVVRHKRWNNMIAVKSLLQKLRDNEEDKALFVKEAETWIDIGFHPNIAACYYVRNILGSPRIFIEYVDGGGLNEWLIRRRPVGWDVIIDLMVQASDGLHHAHMKGLVHRDIKPANCMMTKLGTLKVTDFGLTKRRNVDSAVSLRTDTSETVTIERESVTAAGMGTPGYMAPEMWVPYAEVGPAADIYAFGVMFFEICCGRKPFVIKPGEKRDKLALAHVKQPPPKPTSLRKDLPPQIEELILKCLHKDPAKRYESFRIIRQELAEIYGEVCKKRFTREAPDELKLLSDALNNRAVSLMDLNHEAEADLALRNALKTDPHHPEAVYNAGMIQWIRSGLPEPEQVVRLEEVAKAPEYVGRGSNLLGRYLLGLGEAEKAAKACEAAISAEDSDGSRLKPYGIALIGTGKDLDGISQLVSYLSEFGNDDEAAGWLIAALLRTGRTDEAIAALNSLPTGSELKSMDLTAIERNFVFSGLREILVLSGHSGWITCVAHSPKSQLIVSGARDRNVKIWNSVTGEELENFKVVGEPPAALWISPDERVAAIASAQTRVPIKILDLDTGKFAGNLNVTEGAVTSLAFSDDSARIFTVEQNGNARFWDISDTKAAHPYKIPGHSVSAAFFDAKGLPGLYLAGMDRILRKVQPIDAPPFAFEKVHKDPITAIRCAPDGSKVITASRDKTVVVWDTQTGKPGVQFHGHQELVTALAINPTRDLAATYEPKSGLKLWDTGSGMVLRSYGAIEQELNCIAFTADGDRLMAAGRDMVIRVWDVRGRPIIPPLALAKVMPVTKQMQSDRKFKAVVEAARKAMKHGRMGMAYDFLRNTQKLPGYERSDTVLDLLARLKDYGKRTGLHGGWKRQSVDAGSGVMSVAFSSSGINFFTAQADYTIRMWSTTTADCMKVFKGHTNLVTAIGFSPNGREFASGSDDRTVRIWDPHSGRNTQTLKGHLESVSSVKYSPDGSMLLSGSWDNTLRIWRLPDGALIRTLKGHEDRVFAVNFINAGQHIVSAGVDGVIKMWDTATGRLMRDLRGHKEKVFALDVSPDGDFLLSGSTDDTARIWDIKTGICILTFHTPNSGIRAAVFSPDRKFFVTGGTDGVLRVWNSDSGLCEREFLGHSKEIMSVDFVSNGRFIISASADGQVMIWELDWELDVPKKLKT